MTGTIPVLMQTFGRQRLRSPVRILLGLVALAGGLFPVLLSGQAELLSTGAMLPFALVFAGGMIGQDVSSGVLTLAFARPVRRSDYVLARWLAASTLASACVLLQVLGAAGILLARHAGLTGYEVLALRFLGGVFSVSGVSAVVLALSSLAPGLADLGLLLALKVAVAVGGAAADAKGVAWLARAFAELDGLLFPSLDPAPWFLHGPVSVFAITSYASTLAIGLVVAVWALNRRELSYASD